MNILLGRRFLFGVIAIICVSVTSILLKYTGDVYLKLVATIVGVFLTSQTITDYQKVNKGEGK